MLNEVLGTYIPSAFSIELNKQTKKDIDWENGTFVHEYIHFLQDIMLPYCIRYNFTFLNQCRNIFTIAQGEGRINKPFNKWDNSCWTTNKQNSYTWGDSKTVSSAGEIHAIVNDHFTTEYQHNVYRYVLKFDCGIDYQIGARDLLEYLAHKIQKKFWGSTAPDLPYKTVDLLFEYYQLEFIPESIRLLIVEFCLYNDNPVHFLIRNFFESKEILNNKDEYFTYERCENYLLKLHWAAKGGFFESALSKSNRRLHDFNFVLNAIYGKNSANDVGNWISNTVQYCQTNFTNKFILSGLYNLNYNDLLSFFSELESNVGIPVVKYYDNSIKIFAPEKYHKEGFLEFYIMKYFIAWCLSEDSECPIYDICLRNFDSNKTLDCKTNPIKYSGNCCLKSFLKNCGLENIDVK